MNRKDIRVGDRVRVRSDRTGDVVRVHSDGTVDVDAGLGDHTSFYYSYRAWSDVSIERIQPTPAAGQVWRYRAKPATLAFVFMNTGGQLSVVTSYGRMLPYIEQFEQEDWELVK